MQNLLLQNTRKKPFEPTLEEYTLLNTYLSQRCYTILLVSTLIF